MEKFTNLNGVVLPLDRSNVDTDAIIPKQYLKSIHRSGFGVNLFDEWRYLDPGQFGDDHSKRKLNMDFVLNKKCYKDAKILLTRENFGCGSSREHAPWAILDYGFRCIIAPSFADIFFNNCFKNGILPIVLDEVVVDNLFLVVLKETGCRFNIDLVAQKINMPNGDEIHFEIDSFRKGCLVEGMDEISLTLEHKKDIKKYEEKRKEQYPWYF